MSQSYIILYLILLVFCALLILGNSIMMDEDIGDHTQVVVFRVLCGVIIVDIAMLFLWMAGNLPGVQYSRTVSLIINEADLLSIMLTCQLWFILLTLMTTPTVGRRQYLSDRFYLISSIPGDIVLVMDLASLKTGWIFTCTADGTYVRGPLYIIHALGCLAYLLFTLFLVFFRTRFVLPKRLDNGQYLQICFFPILGGVLQVLYGEAPFTILCTTMAISYLHASLQKNRINTDALTGLNNRSRMNDYLQGRTLKAESDPFWFCICDIDSFKQINDTFGHVNGDEALIVVGDAMRRLGAKHRTLFAARYGGDEFVLAIDATETKDWKDPQEQLTKELNDNISALLTEHNADFTLTLSLGAVYVSRNEPLANIIRRADKRLYDKKKEVHG